MAIPQTRNELVEQVQSAFAKLSNELDDAGSRAGGRVCVDAWTIKDLLAVRAWWTERVVDWIEAGLLGETPSTPAEGYGWAETPRLNEDIVRECRRESYRSVRSRLATGYTRVMDVVARLDDRELLDHEVFKWAGTYPISRWISINTARQYSTARTHIRRAIR